MWPWEHVLFAYVFYSLFVRLVYAETPTDGPAAALAFGSLLPDLVDKTLAWQFAIVDSGYTIGHSAPVAIPGSIAIYAIARNRGVSRPGLAFGFGYLLHLVGDVLPTSLVRGELYVQHVLWPIGSHEPTSIHDGLLDGIRHYLFAYVDQIFALDPTPVLVLQLGSVLFGSVIWVLDGAPGVRYPVSALYRASRHQS